MMNVTPRGAIAFTKGSTALACSWPPSLNSTKSKILAFDIRWYLFFLSNMMLALPLHCAVYEYRNDPVIVTESLCLSCAVVSIYVKMIICRVQHSRLQKVIFDMEYFCKHADAYEESILQRYVDKYKMIHFCYTLWCYFTTAVVISGPLILPQDFPTHATYPFPVDHHPVKEIIYFHQSFAGFQASAGMTVESQIAVLLWYTTVRFEILASKLRNFKTEKELDACIEEHNRLLDYVDEINCATNLLVLVTVVTTGLGVIFGAVNLVGDNPIMMKIKFIVLVFTCCAGLFVCALPADTLSGMTSEIATDIYCAEWFSKPIRVQRKIVNLILRSQKPQFITVSGVLPNLSLSYYASFLYTSFSYFTAVRVMFTTDK